MISAQLGLPYLGGLALALRRTQAAEPDGSLLTRPNSQASPRSSREHCSASAGPNVSCSQPTLAAVVIAAAGVDGST